MSEALFFKRKRLWSVGNPVYDEHWKYQGTNNESFLLLWKIGDSSISCALK